MSKHDETGKSLEQMLADLGITPNYNGLYPGWVMDMAERLIESGWIKPGPSL